MLLSAIAAKLKSRSKDDFKGRHFEAGVIIQVVSCYLRDPLSSTLANSPSVCDGGLHPAPDVSGGRWHHICRSDASHHPRM